MQPDQPSHSPVGEAQLSAILRWYVDMGVDLAIGDAPRNHFAEGAEKAARSEQSAPSVEGPAPVSGSDAEEDAPQAGRRIAPVGRMLQAAEPLPVRSATGSAISPEIAQASARDLAASAPSLDALREALEGFDGCALKRTASRLVFADGNPQARIMLVGEAPGADEDRQGLPFVGRAGQMLDRMLAAIGLDRSKVYISNVVPWRPPGNRAPTQPEIATCLPFAQRQIELVDPDILVCVGNISAQALLGQREGITRIRGKWLDYPCGSRRIPAIAMFHPAYLLRTPVNKRYAWQDIRAIGRAVDKHVKS